MKRHLYLSLLLLGVANFALAQTNPYESLGIEVEVLTLSKGKYKEHFDDERIVQIGNAIFDIETMKLVGIINKDSIPNNFYLAPMSDSRWISPDPLADEFVSVSPYNFGNNNPIRFNDPTGLAPEDIIVGGNKTEQRRILGRLQALTNDKLSLNPETGEVVILSSGTENSSKSLSEGSNLIRTLVKDDNTVTITPTIQGTGTEPLNEEGYIVPANEVEVGKEFDSQIGFQLDRSVNTVNADGTRGGVPNFISLAHELDHARSNSTGNNDRNQVPAYDFDTQQIRSIAKEEYKTRVNENKIRKEHNLILRALPLLIPRL